jgi:imidazolonepropionase-like amidohydrolase
MKLKRWFGPVPVACVLVAAFWMIFSAPPTKTVEAADETLALTGGKIYTSPEDAPIASGVVVMRGGKIAAVGASGSVEVPAGAKILDCKGLVVTAGFQNSHVHFDQPDKWTDAANIAAPKLAQRLADMLTRYGFTTAVDTGSLLSNTVAIRKRIESGEVRGPRILTAGGPLYPPNGVPYYLKKALPPEILKLLAQPETPEAAVKVVDNDLDGGADIIKLFTGSWVERGEVKPMPLDIASAAVAEAHQHGRLVFTHPSNVAGLKVALEAHVDVLAHAIEDLRGWNASYLGRMKAANMALIPTLNLFSEDSDLQGILDEVGAYQRAGGQLVFGTDAGYMSDYDPTKEYLLMARAGLTQMQILASLTTAPADRFGEASKRGRVALGMDAELVVLDADPVAEAANFSKVRYTVRRGRLIYPLPLN